MAAAHAVSHAVDFRGTISTWMGRFALHGGQGVVRNPQHNKQSHRQRVTNSVATSPTVVLGSNEKCGARLTLLDFYWFANMRQKPPTRLNGREAGAEA